MLITKRLILRPWKKEDLEPFAEMSQDPKVMEFFPSLLTKEESDRLAARFEEHIEKTGWGLFAAEEKESSTFIGFIGLSPITLFKEPFAQAVEIGWRLAHPFWNKGYATEGAKAALEYGFNTLNLKEIVAFTASINLRSQNVMKKIGMHHNPIDDFDHPKIPEGNILRHHVLYRLNKHEFLWN